MTEATDRISKNLERQSGPKTNSATALRRLREGNVGFRLVERKPPVRLVPVCAMERLREPAHQSADSHQTIRPHWSQVGRMPDGSALPRAADSTSEETFRWQPEHLPPRKGTQTGIWRTAIRS